VFNMGFAETRGEIIATPDGDEVWLPGKIRAVAEEFERYLEAGLVYARIKSGIRKRASGATVSFTLFGAMFAVGLRCY